MLPYGTYRIEETKGADGYRVIEPFDIVIDQNGKIYKYIYKQRAFRHISLCLDMLDKIALCIVNIILRTV